jgi:hypothetical protein
VTVRRRCLEYASFISQDFRGILNDERAFERLTEKLDIAITNQAAGVGLRDTALRRHGSSHGMNGLGLDLIKDAHFTRCPAGIAILAEIFLGNSEFLVGV